MITTTQQQREATSRSRTWRAPLALLGLVILLSACTHSKLIIGPLYNRLDDRIRSEFNKLGDFNDEQTAAFEESVGTFHVWHRQSELPQYAVLLRDVANSIAQPDATSADDVRSWIYRVEDFSKEARQCYPANFMTGTIRTLPDEQLIAIERRFRSERGKNRKRHASRTTEERIAYRLENVEKWLGRIQLKLSKRQLAILRQGMEQQVSLRKQYYVLSDQWNRRLFNMARNQEAPDYETKLRAHMESLWSLLEDNHPAEWRANRELWQGTILELVDSLSAAQRRQASLWLANMAKTLEAVSRDKPSFQVKANTTAGCLVKPSGTSAG